MEFRWLACPRGAVSGSQQRPRGPAAASPVPLETGCLSEVPASRLETFIMHCPSRNIYKSFDRLEASKPGELSW